jgi:hypothetical protein
MWGQAMRDEGKVQGALSLWRKSARDFHRNDEDDNPVATVTSSVSDGTEATLQRQATNTDDTATDSAVGGEHLGIETNFSDGEFADSDFVVTPTSRNRKRRGSVTRRR